MRYLVILAAASLAGCATQHAVSHIQDYRPKGQDNTISIQGAIAAKPGLVSNDYTFMARLDNVTRIGLDLGVGGNGEVSCKAGEKTKTCEALPDRGIGASCISSTQNSRVVRINCTVFIDNERAAIFTF